jgi:hypothetical protein
VRRITATSHGIAKEQSRRWQSFILAVYRIETIYAPLPPAPLRAAALPAPAGPPGARGAFRLSPGGYN